MILGTLQVQVRFDKDCVKLLPGLWCQEALLQLPEFRAKVALVWALMAGRTTSPKGPRTHTRRTLGFYIGNV